jgi:hypothetical protein
MKNETITLGELFTALTSPPDPWYGENANAQELVDRYIWRECMSFGNNFDFKLVDNFHCPQGNDRYPQQYEIPQKMLVVIWYTMYLDLKKTSLFHTLQKNSERYSWNDCKSLKIDKIGLKSLLNNNGRPLPVSIFGKCKNNTIIYADRHNRETKSAWDDIFQEEIIDKRISEILSKTTSSLRRAQTKEQNLRIYSWKRLQSTIDLAQRFHYLTFLRAIIYLQKKKL